MNYDTVVSWDSNLIDVWYTDIDNPLVKGLVKSGVYIVTGSPAATAGKFMPGAVIYNAVDGTMYIMTGTTAAPVWSLVESSGLIPNSKMVFNTVSTSGADTIPAAKMVDGILDRDQGAADASDTTDTAAAIVAAIPGAAVGSSFVYKIRNISATSGQKITILAGVGVTISGIADLYAGSAADYIGIVTNVGTPAVTLYRIGKFGLIDFEDVASSVNTLMLKTAATGNSPIVGATGSDTNIGLRLVPKGSGVVDNLKGTVLASAPNYIASETGGNNAIAGALLDANGVAVPLAAGLRVVVQLAHTLQAGANTFVFNAVSKNIKSSRNVANNIATAYAATGAIDLLYDGTEWVDMSQ